MAKPRALITGIAGQDGAFVGQLLIAKGYEVFGIHRPDPSQTFWRLKSLGLFDQIKRIEGDLRVPKMIEKALGISQPDEVYHLAAFSLGGNASFENPVEAMEVNGLCAVQLLEALRLLSPKTKIFLALSGEIFGSAGDANVFFNESSRPNPVSPYAVAKWLAGQTARLYRDRYGLPISCGILFNHESPFRSPQFVTRKISMAVSRIALGMDQSLSLGDLSASRDWGYAPEYAEAMWRMLQAKDPDDYIIATGKTYSVRDLVNAAFDSVHLSPEPYVRLDNGLYRPIEVRRANADPSKINERLGWKAQKSALDTIRLMTLADRENWEKRLGGEIFPWDSALEESCAPKSPRA